MGRREQHVGRRPGRGEVGHRALDGVVRGQAGVGERGRGHGVGVAEGDEVEAGATVATIEAMKMEAAITATVTGRVERLALSAIQQVEGGDLVLVIVPV